MAQSKDIWRKIIVLAVVGGLAFWAISIITSLLPFAADYRVARWSAETVWVGSLPAGMIIGFFVSFFLLRFFNKIPTKNPILKSLMWLSIQKAVRIREFTPIRQVLTKFKMSPSMCRDSRKAFNRSN